MSASSSLLLLQSFARTCRHGKICLGKTSRYLSYSRMLDMGGAPSAMNDGKPMRVVNASKNSKLQAVAFDYEVLTRSVKDSNKGVSAVLSATVSKTLHDEPKISASSVKPDVSRIEQLASLLNVKLGESSPSDGTAVKSVAKGPQKSSFGEVDVRAKYARKIKGGLAGVELAKSSVSDALQKGDASGHFAAKKLSQTAPSSSNTRWMAQTGTGKLLSFLTKRSVQIALLPAVGATEPDTQMDDFSRQLNDVVIDVVIQASPQSNIDLTMEQLMKELNLDPGRVLLVSDRDDYLKAARDLSMITCRLRPKNARRGNLTAHYTVETIPEVHDVVNEINGISFNAVIN